MFIVMGAMDGEVEGFLNILVDRVDETWKSQKRVRGNLAGRDVIVAKSGVGKVLSALTTQELIDRYHPRAFIFTGLAGGIAPDLDTGDTVVANDLVQHDFDVRALGFALGEIPYSPYRFIGCDPRLRDLLKTYVPRSGKMREGRIGTGDQFIASTSVDSRKTLRDELGVDAVEMEGAAVALVCAVNEVPCIVVRTISDRADGQAAVNFSEFLPRACQNSVDLVSHLLKLI